MLKFINSRNESIEFTDGHPFRLFKIEGIGGPETNLQMQKSPFQDGNTYIDNTLESRPISIEFGIFANDRTELYGLRHKISRIFNSKLGLGTLVFNFGGLYREINAIVENGPLFPDGEGNETEKFQRGLIDFICPDPFWLSKENVEQLTVWEGGLEFPLELPTEFAILSEERSKIIFNEGDVETPIIVVFNGPASAPIRVENITTGEFIEVNQGLQSGERLEINTAFGKKRVEKVLENGERINAFHYIDLQSKFFQLIPGNNLINYSTGEDYERAAVSITWNNRYVGV